MYRRSILTGAVAAAGALFAARSASAAPVTPDKRKAVYHLCDLDKVAFVLGNIRNHIDGVGGPDKVTLALVVHGPALKAFHAGSASPAVRQKLGALAQAGVQFAACGNTMKAQNVAPGDLLPGFVTVEEGGVVRLAELQSQGYVYLKP